jgi:hypothetical protein
MKSSEKLMSSSLFGAIQSPYLPLLSRTFMRTVAGFNETRFVLRILRAYRMYSSTRPVMCLSPRVEDPEMYSRLELNVFGPS